MTTLLGVPLAILPQVIDTRYFFFVYNAHRVETTMGVTNLIFLFEHKY